MEKPEVEKLEVYTDEQKWYLLNIDIDGTLLCSLFFRKFKEEMTDEKNRAFIKELRDNKIITFKPLGWLSRIKPHRKNNLNEIDLLDKILSLF
jgi:hypothetical protein